MYNFLNRYSIYCYQKSKIMYHSFGMINQYLIKKFYRIFHLFLIFLCVRYYVEISNLSIGEIVIKIYNCYL